MSRKRKRVPQEEDAVQHNPPSVIVRTPPSTAEPKAVVKADLMQCGINDLSDRLGSMSVRELREECSTNSLKAKGNRRKLVKRLMHKANEQRKKAFEATLSNLQVSSSEKQVDTAGHARKLVMSMFINSGAENPLRENISLNSPENPFPWPTDDVDDVYVKIAGLWRHGAVEYSTTSKMMIRIPGVINTTGTFHWFPCDSVIHEPPELMFSLEEELGDNQTELNENFDEEETVEENVEEMSLKKLREACISRGLSKNGNKKKLQNRLRKVLTAEKKRRWIETAGHLPEIFVRSEHIYDRKSGKFHHSEIGPNKACKLGLALFNFGDFISASHLLRRYILETPASSTKDFHGIACLTFMISLIKAYPYECGHDIVKQEIDYAFSVANQWMLSNETLLEGRVDLQSEFDVKKGEVLRLLPRLKVQKSVKQNRNNTDGIYIMEHLYKACAEDGNLNRFQKFLLAKSADYVVRAFKCKKSEISSNTGLGIGVQTVTRINSVFTEYINNYFDRFLSELIVYFKAFFSHLKKLKSQQDEYLRKLTFRELGLHEPILSFRDTKKIFNNILFDSNEFLIIQCILLLGLYRLNNLYVNEKKEKPSNNSQPDFRRKRRAAALN